MENTTSMTTLEAITADSETTPKTGGRFDSSLNPKHAEEGYRLREKIKNILSLIALFILESCLYGKQDTFFVKFINSDEQPIDIKRYNENGNREEMYSRLGQGKGFTHQAYFTQNWLFLKSDTRERLNARANGVVAETFEGCRFKAEANKQINVNISGGTKIILSSKRYLNSNTMTILIFK